MYTIELLDYIKSKLHEAVPVELIIKNLESSGWYKENIKEAFSILQKDGYNVTLPENYHFITVTSAEIPDNTKLYLAGIGLFTLSLLIHIWAISSIHKIIERGYCSIFHRIEGLENLMWDFRKIILYVSITLTFILMSIVITPPYKSHDRSLRLLIYISVASILVALLSMIFC